MKSAMQIAAKHNVGDQPNGIGCVISAMEEYALQASKDGYVSGSDAVHKILKPEIDRLRDLVKAQKELIALYDEENLSDPAWLKESELRNKIKTLEQ